MSATAFYTRDGERFVPTGVGVSPWNARAQMGVGLAGLVVHALEAVPSPVAMFTPRLTIDILGAVPIAPLSATVRVVREGRRAQVVDAELRIDGRTWVRASALRLRIGDSPDRAVPLAQPPREDGAAGLDLAWAETVRLHGEFDRPGPGAMWVRMRCELIAGVALSPLAAIAMISDFGSGVAPLVRFRDWTFANVDISIHLTRPPQGAWILLDAGSESAGNGIGLTHSRLGDERGMIGMAHQTTFLERR